MLSGFDVSDFTFGSTISGYTYSLDFVGASLQLTAAVPEPSVWGLLVAASALFSVALRRRKLRVS